MKFDKIHDNLYAVREEGETDNVLQKLFEEWNDVSFLHSFFTNNIKILNEYFHVKTVTQAVNDTLDDAESLENYLFDNYPLDEIFTALDKNKPDVYLVKSKARKWNRPKHDCWLRIYALKLDHGIYVVTGGAIKMTKIMQDNEITFQQLNKLNKCRNFLENNGVYDFDGFYELTNNVN